MSATKPETPGGGGGGGDGGGSGSGGSKKCLDDGKEIPCHSETFGWYMGDGCYAKALDPQPPADDPAFDGRPPGGAIYMQICLNGEAIVSQGWIWLQTPPNGPQVTPAQLAQQALEKLTLRGPDIGMAPEQGKTGVVGMPVWMWNNVSAETWGPNSASASVPGLTVTATAKATKIVWNMGDGNSVTCNNAGTPYEKSYGKKTSPTCGHVYSKASDKFTVTATTTWNVHWTGGGQQGDITVTRESQTAARIGEVQVVD
ncbi:ATP/GTP-binding protein [Streptomyces sp. WMMC940]|uniref:ATP/GTP-binding protein n=1 Tax=Streptomyces sp. WMMC940 TaxID=3015153 RepID=UPI0022B6C709|nr:ATP/GTP-binding protein [Streptomyces sp. WMMC940]MCZ7458222.1 ATP/GTP-binding protein [Streptomyces sp. WMMC940]